MTKCLLVLWAYVISWVCAAFLHGVDADVGTFQGLLTSSVLLSTSIVAFFIFIPVLLCHLAYSRGHWRGFFTSVSGFSMVMGILMVLMGFGGTSTVTWLISIVGSVFLFGLFLIIATLPMIWASRVSRSQS
ncbi:MAG: hypothetical protein GY752_04200 [bacterium]|nr:hypothetical protein [bacterium]MCP4799113.1 hypothetical protein [bacterium]